MRGSPRALGRSDEAGMKKFFKLNSNMRFFYSIFYKFVSGKIGCLQDKGDERCPLEVRIMGTFRGEVGVFFYKGESLSVVRVSR